MEIVLTEEAKKDLDRHKKSGNKANMRKIEQLFYALLADAYTGIGQPEALKFELTGKWSRRINMEYRMVYSVNENEKMIYIESLWGHYKK